jgi:glycosyltransferase involved in cell wall biosynthesis
VKKSALREPWDFPARRLIPLARRKSPLAPLLQRGGGGIWSSTDGLPSGRPIRVVRVIARLNVGGPAWHVILLTAGLDPARFQTTLVTGVPEPAEGDLGPAAAARGVRPVLIPELGRAIRPAQDLVALWKLTRLFRQLRPDIVHTHTAKAGALGRAAAILAGIPIRVHTFHGHVLEGYFAPAVTQAFLAIERALARRTTRIVTVSPRLREELLRMGIGRPGQVEAIPLGLELQRFARPAAGPPALRQALRLPPDAALLGIVGRLVPIKDHPTLFAALARLPASPSVHLAVVGDGERRAALVRLVGELGLGARVHFLGWRDDLEAILREMDVVICSSRNEGTPVSLIEAMAAGVPVLSTAVGGVADLVTHGETGWLVPAGEPAALAEGIRALLADGDLRARLARAGQAAALARHDVTRLLPRMEALYAGLLAARPPEVRAARPSADPGE